MISTFSNQISRRFYRRGSLQDAEELDVDKDGTISKDELSKYIEKNAKLWAMLAVNLNLPEQTCREIATQVAYQLAKNIDQKHKQVLPGFVPCDRDPTVEELSDFIDFIQTPKGEQEFFHRTVFCAFDSDGNGYLDYDELDRFLDVFYEAGSIFAGDSRLPYSKFILKLKILVEFDANQDGQLTFEEMRTLLAGGAQSIIS